MARFAGRRPRRRRAGAGALPDRAGHRRGPQEGRSRPLLGQHRLPQHDPAREAGPASRRPGDRAPHPLGHPLERHRDHPAGQQGLVRARRPHRQLPVGRDPLRHRLHAFLAGGRRQPRRRPDLRAGPFLARHLCPRLPRGAPHRGAAPRLPPGGRRQGPVVLSASLADAGFLAVPHRLDGPRPPDGDLPGALPALPAPPRPRADGRPQGLGLHGRRRDGRAGEPGRDRARRRARNSTTSSSSSTATCSASTGRCAATARSSRSSRPISAAPAGTSSRCCGARAGTP